MYVATCFAYTNLCIFPTLHITKSTIFKILIDLFTFYFFWKQNSPVLKYILKQKKTYKNYHSLLYPLISCLH
jgi:hypothetical protein